MKTLAIIIGKLLAFAGSLVGKGSATPGAIALKICPDLGEHLVLPKIKIAITGSSGKGSTSALVAGSLKKLGYRVAHNNEGSNMKAGILTMLIKSCSLSGRVKVDVVVAELDERSCKYVFPFLKPDFVVVTNITRDQPPRQRHTDFIFSEIKQALSGNEHLILNGDDPLLMQFALTPEDGLDQTGNPLVTTFGITANTNLRSLTPRFENIDIAYCPLCSERLEYQYYLFEALGSFHCSQGHFNHQIDVALTGIKRGQEPDGSKDTLVVEDTWQIQANSRLLFNLINVMAAYTVLRELPLALEPERIAKTMSEIKISQKIFSTYQWLGRQVYVVNNKAENATTFNQSVLFAADLPGPLVLVVGWMEISRRYNSDDLAWLFDVNFDLVADRVSAAICTGVDADTIAMRLKYAGVPEERITSFNDMDSRMLAAMETTAGDIVAVLNFDHVEPFNRLFVEGGQR